MKLPLPKRGWMIPAGLFLILTLYLLAWPVPIDPVGWNAPDAPGYTGAHKANQRLSKVELLSIGNETGPESVAVNSAGDRFAATHSGVIVRIAANETVPKKWVDTGGRPLGITFDAADRLVVADGFNGLLRYSKDKKKTVLTTTADSGPLCYVNNVDIASGGNIYFSDSSSKFCAKEWGGTYPASLLDIMEHGGHGRLLMYNPQTQTTRTLLKGLQYANGVALDPAEQFVLVVETGSYQIVRHWLAGPKKGQTEPFAQNLPAFPDNLTTGRDGRFWVGFISPRSAPLDAFSDKPFVRKMIQRLPAMLRPKAKPYGHVSALNSDGEVVLDLQDPTARYPMVTEATETADYVYLGSLFADKLGRIKKSEIGL